ncbi:MAG TPA: tRNA (guanine(46)-N(7))-methyltransferase TrmB [Rhizomicrobium sp.]
MEISGLHRRKLYGRRKGPKLSRHQSCLLLTLLPQLVLKLEPGRDPRTYFPNTIEDVWLEIGFGGGEHLFWQAHHHPNIGLIGAEPYETGVAKLLSKVASNDVLPGTAAILAAQEKEKRAGSPRSREATIRIYQGDARDIVEALPDACLGRVFILFPDPWPKTRHHKRRFIQMDMLDALARVMKPGAELRFASDDSHYAAWTLERALAHRAFEWTATGAGDWQVRPADWPATRYEEKSLHGAPMFLRFVRSA